MNLDELLDDLAPFSDLGEGPLSGQLDNGHAVIRLTRNSITSTITLQAGGVVEALEGEDRRFKSLAAMLASQRYADLPLWADRQKSVLASVVSEETIKIIGNTESVFDVDAVEAIDGFLNAGKQANKRNSIVVIDGPAGIGKTSVVRKLTYERALSYRRLYKPLILHVESRGRVLQNISDLMAFSLQSLRLNVTFDQVPTLVKYGLLTLAIDGFDELGDPNGYDLAWAQLNDLLLSVQGAGSFILSGRETFISGYRIQKALPSINLELDSLDTFTVSTVAPSTAKAWLRSNGWQEEALQGESAEPLFQRNSYALRPFFLSLLAVDKNANAIQSGIINDTLSFLIELMLEREQQKFGDDVDAATSPDQRRAFVFDLMEEVARDIADNQTDAIAAETLSWLSDAVSFDLPEGVRGILRNRADVIGFLTSDVRRGYRRFVHEEVESYFLANSLMKSIISGEIPKYVRRNIFGLDFLENFAETIRYKNTGEIDKFLDAALSVIAKATDQDRSKRNIASLVLAALYASSDESVRHVSDVSMDEAFIGETPSPIKLERVTIGQLDARSADLRNIEFKDCAIITLIADYGTIPSQTIPTPSVLALPTDTVTRHEEKEAFFARQYWEKTGYLPRVRTH